MVKGKKSEIKYTVREKKADVANWISFKVYRGWIKIKSKHKILKEKDTNKDKKILTSKSRFRGTFSEDLSPNVSSVQFKVSCS